MIAHQGKLFVYQGRETKMWWVEVRHMFPDRDDVPGFGTWVEAMSYALREGARV